MALRSRSFDFGEAESRETFSAAGAPMRTSAVCPVNPRREVAPGSAATIDKATLANALPRPHFAIGAFVRLKRPRLREVFMAQQRTRRYSDFLFINEAQRSSLRIERHSLFA